MTPDHQTLALPSTLQAAVQDLAQAGSRDAIVSFEANRMRVISYRDLAAEVERRARGLLRAGVGLGDPVILCGPGGADWIMACLAVLHCGACVVPVDATLGAESFRHVLRDSGARIALVAQSSALRLHRPLEQQGARVLPMAQDDAPDDSREATFARVGPGDRAILFYTSGTTGPPKGVPVTHGNLIYQLRVLAGTGIVSAEDRVLLPLPMHHVYPLVLGVLTPLAAGIAVVLPAGFTGTQLVAALQSGRPTVMIGVPRLFDALTSAVAERMRHGGPVAQALFRGALGLSRLVRRRFGWRIGRMLFAPLHRRLGPSLRVVVSGGAALRSDTAWTMEALGWEVASGYGLTETSPMLTIHPPGAMRFETVGCVIPETELRIEGAREGNAEGEVLARGPGVFAGYHELPEKTAEAFTADGWFRTGDLGRIDASGWLCLTGRRSTVIVTEGGKNLQPEEIEEVYQAHPAIEEIAILQHDGRLAGLIVPARAEDGGEAAIREAVREVARALPSYQHIAEYRLTAEPIPRTRLGKPRRQLIVQAYARAGEAGREDRDRASGLVPIETLSADDRALLEHDTAQTVLRMLGERFADRRIGPDSDLQLDLGIDSIGWLDLSLDIADQAGVTLSDATIGEIRTVRDLLVRVAEGGDAGADARLPLEEPERVLGEDGLRWLEPRGTGQRIAGRVLAAANRLVFRRLFGLCVRGAEALPATGPFVLAPNHASYLDPFAIAAALDAARLERMYWAGWSRLIVTGPLRRGLARIAGILPVDDGRATAASIAFGSAALRRGHALAWFPEGIRSADGQLQPFKAGIGVLLARRNDVPVVPVVLRGTFEAWPRSRRLPRFRRLSVEFLAPCTPAELAAGGTGDTEGKRIVNALRTRIAVAIRTQAN
ncbi:AMP-binding protein [Falsiroseomonas sp. HC035]|uniref:AMP-binding protein n=1 Tax=Falsiroseomonas sp. HC035 TaxID=3390999 RepID=UPI003D31C3AC